MSLAFKNMKISIIYLVVLINYLQRSVTSQSVANCEYYNNKDNGYTCKLSVREYESLTHISGQHLREKSDDDIRRVIPVEGSILRNYPSFICEQFKNVERLRLSHTFIETIDETSFKKCEKLNDLNLQANKISELKENVFVENRKLTYLSVAANSLRSIPKKVFVSQLQLAELDLSGNVIEMLPDGVFDTLENLNELDMQKNKLTTLPPGIFRNLKNLEILDLGRNQLTVLNTKWFESTTALTDLYMNRNKILELPPNVFTHLTKLEHLWIQDNKLTTIHSHSFSSHPQLDSFLFTNNKVRAIDEKIIDNTSVRRIEGIDNPCVDQDQFVEDETETKSKIRAILKRCFENFNRRHFSTNERSKNFQPNF